MDDALNRAEDPHRARQLVQSARRIIVLTGAGVSAESGVPTFRGADGLWRNFRPEDLATPQAFARDRRLVWEWYGWRRERVTRCRPNAAHEALARLALGRGGVRIVTQNVDGLHANAASAVSGGSDPGPALPLELHGSIFRVRCTACSDRYPHREPIDSQSEETLPRCRRCRAVVRPDVVWFGEPLDAGVLQEAFDAAAQADVCLVVGTSAVVQPAASIATVTRSHGGEIIEVNPEPTPITPPATVSLRARAAEAVPAIVLTAEGH